MKKTALIFITIFLFTPNLLAQQYTPKDLDKVVSSLHHYMAVRPQEKIYIHFDKPFYSLGDTVWFKLYLVNALGNRLSSISKVAYIDILAPDGKLKQIVLPVNAGMAAAQLVLSDSLYKAGNYPLRAYTTWMRNAGENYFFSHTLPVGNVIADKASAVATISKTLVLDFFPEGGSLVAGIRSKVAFKAIGNDGIGVNVKGYIWDDKGEQVAVFESLHAGMGAFALLPQAGGAYTAVVTDGPFKDQRFTLPKALSAGFVLSVNPSGADDFLVRISRSAGTEAYKEVRLVLQANGEVLQALKLPMNSPSMTFALSKSQMDEGINQITLFSPLNQPLAERLVFVQKKQATSSLNSDKPEYETREQVKMKFAVSDEKANGIVGGYSVSIVNTNSVTLSEEKQLSIYANLLLSAELRGKIEDPNYYFSEPDAQKAAELDALLLTQGWRRFSWAQVLAGQAASPKYTPEQGIRISGQITTLGDKPVPGAKITLLVSKDMLLLDTLADTQGRFSFEDLQLSDSVEVILRAKGAKESSNVKIVLDSAAKTVFAFKPQLHLALAEDTAMKSDQPKNPQTERTGKIIQGTTLKTVEIVKKRKAPEIKNSVYPFAAPPPDYTFEPDQLQQWTSLQSIGYLNGVRVRENQIWGRFQEIDGPMVLLLNGTPINDLSGISPKALTGVQIIKGE